MKSRRGGLAVFGVFLLLAFLVAGKTIAQASRFTEQEASFSNGTVELRGTLVLPNNQGPHPAVVFLHGSGPATREGTRSYAEEFAALGLASLSFDKRGSGLSDGSWITSSLEDLAADALAAVEHLKSMEGIDSERIGFWGVSQAGWVATLAASQSQDIDFMILVSGGGASPRESELFSYEQAFDRAGLSDVDIDEAGEVLDAYMHYLETGVGRPELVARLEASRETNWFPHAQLDRILPSEENRPNWSWVASWDPIPHIAKIDCPMLLMFGERDANHPTAIAVRGWKDGLHEAGNGKVTMMVFPGAGHGIRMRDGFSGPGRPPFADGYREAMLGWLWRHVIEK